MAKKLTPVERESNAFWCGYVLGMFVTLMLLAVPLYHCLHNH